MTTQMVVDVDKSVGLMYQENGRLKRADKNEYAAKSSIKTFLCPICNYQLEMSSSYFGESILCPNCRKEPMIQQ